MSRCRFGHMPVPHPVERRFGMTVGEAQFMSAMEEMAKALRERTPTLEQAYRMAALTGILASRGNDPQWTFNDLVADVHAFAIAMMKLDTKGGG
jgi:hypothetical protein